MREVEEASPGGLGRLGAERYRLQKAALGASITTIEWHHIWAAYTSGGWPGSPRQLRAPASS